MKVIDHLLAFDDDSRVPFAASPNVGGELKARYLVMHFTAGGSAESSIRHLTKPGAKVSAHLVIGRDGAITQLVPFDRVAWHAGKSRWDGLVGMNKHAIGIELVNPGPLKRLASGKFQAWFERTYDPAVDDILVARHSNGGEPLGWLTFTAAQLDAALEASQAIFAAYPIREIVGHDDISPGRKVDPGPAFPMPNFKSHLERHDEDEADRYFTTTRLNIRGGPGIDHEKLGESPLARGTEVEALSRNGDWVHVDVPSAEIGGWVHSDFLVRNV